MGDFGAFRGFGEKLTQGETPTKLGNDTQIFSNVFDTPYFAYSLRRVVQNYSGSCIRVRRSNDNAEQDIGFVNDYLDTASLLSFVGANNGLVTTWYDQCGNGNMTQTTAAFQPEIVLSGALYYLGQNPTMRFSLKWFQYNPTPTVNMRDVMFVEVANVYSGSNYGRLFTRSNGATVETSVTGNLARQKDTGIYGARNAPMSIGIIGSRGFLMPFLDHSPKIIVTGTTTENTLYCHMNNDYRTIPVTTTSVAYNRFAIADGINTSGDNINADISEVIIYNKDYYSQIEAIKNNVNSYYGIY
jgi:hypothetical protein